MCYNMIGRNKSNSSPLTVYLFSLYNIFKLLRRFIMPKKLNSGLLRIVALMLLCSLTLTGCLGPEGSSTTHSGLTQDIIQDCTSENTVPQITTTIHEHTFKDATCTLAKICSTCSVTEGEPLGHTWKPATCTTPVTCDTCGQTDGTPIEHNWKKATCTTASTCEYCGQTKGTTIDHNWKEATCTEAATCIVCGKTKGSTTEHKWKSATCTTPKTCKVCGNTKGSTAAHKYSKGKCTTCGDKDPSYGESTSSMVWIPTNGGKKYHSHSGCSNMKNPEKVSLSKAKKLGFTACKKCYG